MRCGVYVRVSTDDKKDNGYSIDSQLRMIKEYGLNDKLKTKQKGRNRDYLVSEMGNYQQMKEQIEKHQKDIDKIDIKTNQLDNNSSDIRNMVNNLKNTLTSKDKYVLKETDKNRILNYLDQVNDTNNDYKKIKELSIALNNVNDELNDNKEKIKILTENNIALSLRVSTLEKQVDKKDKKIFELEIENKSLKEKLEYWKNRFMEFIRFLKDKMFGYKEEQEEYKDIASDMYSHGILKDDKMRDIKDDYIWNKENNRERDKDDYEIGL